MYPLLQAPVMRSELIYPLFLLGKAGTSSLGSSIYFINLSSGTHFFVTVFQTLNCCHLDVQVSIKLCKNNNMHLEETLILSSLEKSVELFRLIQCYPCGLLYLPQRPKLWPSHAHLPHTVWKPSSGLLRLSPKETLQLGQVGTHHQVKDFAFYCS
jgi:hypothetical protein